MAAAAAALPTAASASSADCSAGASLDFGAGNWPTACWRPYSDSSPFNTQLDTNPPLMPGSAGDVNQLESGGGVAYMVTGDPKRPDGVAVYYSRPTDPTFTLHCTEDWGTCPIEGMQIHIPAGAMPAGSPGTDAHMTVVDQESGWEYDLWAVDKASAPASGGELSFGWGGRTRIDGNGLDSYAVAARFGSLGGLIRSQELAAGEIDHALQMFVPCTTGHVYPADHDGLDCAQAGMPTSGALPMGAHLRLGMSVAEIDAGHYPAWKRAVLVALSRYGAYVADTTGDASFWGFRMESSASYQSFGSQDPAVALAQHLGIKPDDYNHNGWKEYWFDLRSGVPWGKLQVVQPCTADASCTDSGPGPVGGGPPPSRTPRARGKECGTFRTHAAPGRARVHVVRGSVRCHTARLVMKRLSHRRKRHIHGWTRVRHTHRHAVARKGRQKLAARF